MRVTARLKNASCAECHDAAQPETVQAARACVDCHGEDMGIKAEEHDSFAAAAIGYVHAMHDLCTASNEINRSWPSASLAIHIHRFRRLRDRSSERPAEKMSSGLKTRG
jgi:hypothetical protein